MAFVPKSFQADFSNSYTSQVSGKEKTSSGTLSFMAPGNIRFEVTKPDKILFISNDKKSWYYTPAIIEGEPGDLKIGKPDPYHLLDFFKALDKGLTSGNDFDAKTDGLKSELVFKKHFSEKFKISAAELNFSDQVSFKTLTELRLTYADGKKLKINFSKVDTSVTLSKKDFTFEPPEKTIISN